MPRVAILESDILIALDISKSIEQEGLAEVDIYEELEQAYQKLNNLCLLYTSDAADDLLCVDLGGRRIITKKKKTHIHKEYQ